MMRTHGKLLLAALATMLVLLTAAGSATALRSISIARERIEATSSAVTFSAEGLSAVCSVTIIKFISVVIPKIIGILMGSGQFQIGRCRSELGEVTITELTGHRLYFAGFVGTLPNVTAILLRSGREGGFLVRYPFGACLYNGGEFITRMTVNARSELEGLTIEERATIRLVTRLSGICPETARIAGRFTIPPIPIRLI
jgi:hypothetical protein